MHLVILAELHEYSCNPTCLKQNRTGEMAQEPESSSQDTHQVAPKGLYLQVLSGWDILLLNKQKNPKSKSCSLLSSRKEINLHGEFLSKILVYFKVQKCHSGILTEPTDLPVPNTLREITQEPYNNIPNSQASDRKSSPSKRKMRW